MAEFVHWCGNCQIRVYIQRHEGIILDWHNCPYTCEYATQMRCSTKPIIETELNRGDSSTIIEAEVDKGEL